MTQRAFAGPARGVCHELERFRIAHRLSQIIGDLGPGNALVHRAAQHEYGRGDSRFPQLYALVGAGHGQPPRPRVQQALRHGDGVMAVRVVLHHGDLPNLRRAVRPRDTEVFLNRVQRNRQRRHAVCLHKKTLLSAPAQERPSAYSFFYYNSKST